MIRKILNKLRGTKFHSPDYWEQRYAKGGNSGDGSYERLSVFKADVLNDFIKTNKIHSAIELGSGDGNQLSLIQYPQYTGMDISPTAIQKCTELYKSDKTKQFKVYKPGMVDKPHADVALSLDVLYHIVERNLFDTYLEDLFSMADKWVVIYSTDFDQAETTHVVHRKFSEAVASKFPEWKLEQFIKNRYPGTNEQESQADFYFYSKK